MKNRNINVRIDDDLNKSIIDKSKEQNISKSQYIIECIRKDINNQNIGSVELMNYIMAVTDFINNIDRQNCNQDTYEKIIEVFRKLESEIILEFEKVKYNLQR